MSPETRLNYICFICVFYLSGLNSALALSVVDDTDHVVELEKSALRVITLAPSLTEMVFTVGAGDKIVATVKSSNYPEAAKKIPRIGNYERFNIETLLSFRPDLVLAWSSGNNKQQVEKIKQFNIPVYQIEPRHLTDIAKALRNIGTLLDQVKQATMAADNFEQRLMRIKNKNKKKPKLRAFYQIWHAPIYTVNGQHVISRIMQICGLENIFEQAHILAPKVTLEAVIQKNPEMIIASGKVDGWNVMQPEWLSNWKKWPTISAVANNNLYFIHPDIINRQSTRILDGAERMCEQADMARKNLKKQL